MLTQLRRVRSLALPPLLLAVLAASPLAAQAPPTLPLQGVLSNAEGEPLTDAVRIRFAIYDAPFDGTELWSETQRVTVDDGLFTVQLGDSESLDMTMFANTSPLWIGISVDGDSEMDRVPLGSVPWAAWADRAGDAETLGGRSAEDLLESALASAASAASAEYAPLNHQQPWASVTGVPEDLADGDDDLLARMVCSVGQILRYGPVGWVCDNEQLQLLDTIDCAPGQVLRYGLDGWYCGDDVDTDSLAALGCTPGQIAVRTAAGWACGADVDTNTDTLADLGCAPGQIAVRAGAGWACGADANSGGDITAVRAGTGITGGAEAGDATLGVDFATVQRRVSGTCAAHQTLRSVNADGSVNCEDRFVVRYSRDAAAEVRNTYNPMRYHLSTTAAAAGGDTTPIPQDIIEDLCGDPDGCKVRLGMTRWSNNNQTAAASREFIFYYHPPTRAHRASLTDNDGIDGNGVITHAFQIWDTCYLTDGQYTDYVQQGDPGVGMALLTWNGYGNPGRTCELTIED